MKKFGIHILMWALYGTLFFPTTLAAQEEFPQPKLGDTVKHDDLGNVTDAFQENFFEALAQKAIENYETALVALRKCEEIDPGKAAVYFEMGKNYHALKKYPEAVAKYKKALQQKPKNPAILEALYQLYLENRQYKKAIPVVQQLQKTKAAYQKDLAELYLKVKNYPMALKMLDQLDKTYGQTNARDSLRRKIYTESNDKQGEEAYLKRKVKEDPGSLRNYTNLIYFYNQLKKVEKGKTIADALAKTHPESALPQLGYYPNYLKENQPEKALKAIQKLLKANQLDPAIKKHVLQDLTGFVKENPAYQATFVKILGKEISGGAQNEQQLGEYYIGQDNAKALDHLEKALKNKPTDFKLLKEVVQLQLAQKQFEKSLALCKKAQDLYPSQAVFYLLKGMAENGLQKYQAALQTLENGLSFLIDAPKTELKFYKQLVLVHKAQGNLKQAETFEKKADRLKKRLQ